MARNRDNKQREASEFEERVVFINRVSKTVKGGRRMSLVALVVVVIAGLLSVLVLTTITNISVSEKNREIATLMVLGYRDDEVALYVYREIDFLAIVGIILGLPVGIFFCLFIFSYVDFGKLSDIQWWSYLLTPILEILMMIVSNLIMLPKIKRTDMNGSLKAVE